MTINSSYIPSFNIQSLFEFPQLFQKMSPLFQQIVVFLQSSLFMLQSFFLLWGFPSGSDSKESACNAGDLGPIPGLKTFPGEMNDNLLQYSCLENSMDRGAWQATVHGVNPWVRKILPPQPRRSFEMATHSSILAWRIPWTEKPGGLQSTGSQRVRHE